MPFRYAFLDLATGILPDDQWRMNRWPLSRDYYLRKFGRMPKTGFHHDWNILTEKRLATLIADIDFPDMLGRVPFPNLLYILGIGLYYTERAERGAPAIGPNIARQMLENFKITPEGSQFLTAIQHGGAILQWTDMPKLVKILEDSAGIKGQALAGTFRFIFRTTVRDFLGRSPRRRNLGEVLAMFARQETFKPDIMAYVFMASEVHILARVQNLHSFGNSFITHASYAMETNLTHREPKHVIEYIRKNGIWRAKPDAIAMEDDAKTTLSAAKKRLENLPVEREFVTDPKHWLWSSANPRCPAQVELAQI